MAEKNKTHQKYHITISVPPSFCRRSVDMYPIQPCTSPMLELDSIECVQWYFYWRVLCSAIPYLLSSRASASITAGFLWKNHYVFFEKSSISTIRILSSILGERRPSGLQEDHLIFHEKTTKSSRRRPPGLISENQKTIRSSMTKSSCRSWKDNLNFCEKTIKIFMRGTQVCLFYSQIDDPQFFMKLD